MAQKPSTNRQVSQESILDVIGAKQCYLGNQYFLSTGLIATNSSETPLLYISNPSSNYNQNGQGGSLGLFNVTKTLQTDTLAADAIFTLYSQPTGVSAGTTITPQNLRPSLGNNSKMIAKLSPTVSGFGTQIGIYVANFDAIDLSSVLTILDPGQSLLITVSASGGNAIAEYQYYEI